MKKQKARIIIQEEHKNVHIEIVGNTIDLYALLKTALLGDKQFKKIVEDVLLSIAFNELEKSVTQTMQEIKLKTSENKLKN